MGVVLEVAISYHAPFVLDGFHITEEYFPVRFELEKLPIPPKFVVRFRPLLMGVAFGGRGLQKGAWRGREDGREAWPAHWHAH